MTFDQSTSRRGTSLKQLTDRFSQIGQGLDLQKLAQQVDWSDLEAVRGLAKNVSQKAAHEGIKLGAHYLGEFLTGWAVTMGIASGGSSIIPSSIMAGIGTALDWGADLLVDNIWPKGREAYAIGDLVLIERERPAYSHDGLRRRRLPSADMVRTAIVTGPEQNGYVEAYDIARKKNDTFALNKLARVPDDVAARVAAESPAIGALQEGVRTLVQDQRRKRYPHSTKPGDYIKWRGQTFTINDVNWGNRTMVLDQAGATFRQVEVQMGDSELRDLGNMTGEFFSAGEFAWWNKEWTDGRSAYPWQLVAIRLTSTAHSNVVDIFEGDVHTVRNHRLAPAYERNEDKSAYAKFLGAVADPDNDKWNWEDDLPANAQLFSINWGLSAANHRSPCQPPPEPMDTTPGNTVAYQANDPAEWVRFNDRLREAGVRGEGEPGAPIEPPPSNNGTIFLVLGAAGACAAAYFL